MTSYHTLLVLHTKLQNLARCIARRPVDCRICSRQLNPSDTISAFSGEFRTAGNNTRSPTACDTSYFSFSKPNGPAIPQQPESMDCRSTPIFRNKDSSAPSPMSDL